MSITHRALLTADFSERQLLAAPPRAAQRTPTSASVPNKLHLTKRLSATFVLSPRLAAQRGIAASACARASRSSRWHATH
jgi:hypothetical protein